MIVIIIGIVALKMSRTMIGGLVKEKVKSKLFNS